MKITRRYVSVQFGIVVLELIVNADPSVQILLLFSFVKTSFNFFTGCLLGAWQRFDHNFCHKQIAHDEISVPLPLFPL